MNAAILVFILVTSGASAACLPEARGLLGTSGETARHAETAAETFQQYMQRELPREHGLTIRLDALNPRVNAEITKQGNELVILVMGGMLQHPRMTPAAFQLLLCHEIGHFLGGPPMKSRTGWSSTEGQSDFYSGAACARLLGQSEADFIEAALVLTSIYAEVGREAKPSLDTCDANVVVRTNFGYPSAQCRLDTLVAGWNGLERPRCWFLKE